MGNIAVVPTKDEFLKTIALYSRRMPSELLNKFTLDIVLLNSPKYADYRPWDLTGQAIDDDYVKELDGLLNLVKEVWQWRDVQVDAGLRSTAGKWLDNFPAMKAAWGALGVGAHLEDLAGYQAKLAFGLLKRAHILSDRAGDVVPASVVQEVFEVMAPVGLNWSVHILCALLEYHYDPEAAKRMIVEHKRLDELESAAMAGFEAAEEVERISNQTWPPKAEEAIPVRYHVGNARDAFCRAIVKARSKVPPIKRLDDTAKERLLIFRLWQGHNILFGAPKPTAILNVIQAGGVHKPDLDVKAIIKSFKGIPVDLTISDIMPNARALAARG